MEQGNSFHKDVQMTNITYELYLRKKYKINVTCFNYKNLNGRCTTMVLFSSIMKNKKLLNFHKFFKQNIIFQTVEISNNEAKLLYFLSQRDNSQPISIEECGESNLTQEEIRSASSWLKMKGMVDLSEVKEVKYELGDEGKIYLENGFPEENLLSLVKDRGEVSIDLVMKIMGDSNARIAIAQISKFGFAPIKGKIRWDADKGEIFKEEIERRRQVLKLIEAGMPLDKLFETTLQNLLKRGDVIYSRKKTRWNLSITEKGREYAKSSPIKLTIGELTPQILLDGSWKTAEFRKYELNLQGKQFNRVGRHPLKYLINEIREIFLQLGFTEMSGNYIESTGWNMDSLFIPQDHPARDMQDTFYIASKNKITFSKDEEKLFKKFGSVQKNGIRGYRGYGVDWHLNESEKLVLRTHTTPNTIRYLSKYNEIEGGYFSVEKVFRHESVDWKHLAEFHQIEGAVHSKDTSLATLKWFLKYFYAQLGFEDIRLVPSYYPYTEPSMDVIVKINGKDVELGGSGIFRPEVLKPLGIKYPVMAWGMGLERLALIYYGLNDLRQLYESDIDWLRNFKIKI